MFKGNRFPWKNERLLQKQPYTKWNFILRRKEKLILRISGSKKRSFSRQKVGRKMIYPSYLQNFHDFFQFVNNNKMVFYVAWNTICSDDWKVLVLNFPEIGITIFFWAKKLMEIWYLPFTEKSLFWTFWRWKIQSFLSQKVDGRMICTDYWKVLVLMFSEMGNAVFFHRKSWWKDDIFLVFFSISWYFRT